MSEYVVQSDVAPEHVQSFVCSLQTDQFSVTPANCDALSALATEFGFDALATACADCPSAPTAGDPALLDRIAALEEWCETQQRETEQLHSESRRLASL
jgi:hypothetical protein